MATVYLDSSVLIAYLYEESDQRERFEETRPLIAAVHKGSILAVVSFYALPELYSHIKRYQAEDQVSSVFRLSMTELFNLPIIVTPFLDRGDLKNLRRQFTIIDPDDVRHVASALAANCNAIVTFDHDFQQVSNLIPAYTPAEFLATLKPSGSTPDSD